MRLNTARFFTYAALVCLPLCFAENLNAQDLPATMTPSEQLMLKDYVERPYTPSGISHPPASPVRAMAEWEEVDAITLAWTSYTTILREIVRNAVETCKVFIFCTDSNAVKSFLTAGSVNITNVRYVLAPFNSVWIRDYGANNVYTHDVDSLLLVDWVYNRPRPKDDTLPRRLAAYTGLPLYETTAAPWKLVHTGGNFMTDGLGTGFSEHLVLDENGPGGGYNQNLSEAQVDTIMHRFMGIDRYIIMTNLPHDGIHHLDMHMKLLDEETLLVGQYPAGVADGPQIEANIQYILANYPSVFGTPYKIVRIPMPPNTSGQYPPTSDYLTFTNSLFVNGKMLVPTYYAQYDTTALRIYRENLPGYDVVGINCNASIPASGAIHCIANCVGSHDPLLISFHKPDSLLNAGDFQIQARIRNHAGIQGALIYYRSDTNALFSPVPMTLTNPAENLWTGYIPWQTAGKTVNYYIQAVSNGGKTQVRPITAPLGYYSFFVDQFVSLQEPVANAFTEMLPAFPNPSCALTCLPVESNVPSPGTLTLSDISGKLVKTIFNGEIPRGKSHYFIDASLLPRGMYLIRMNSEHCTSVQKLVIF